MFSPGGLERIKAELRDEVSGHSSVSDGESDSDSPTEVNIDGSDVHYERNVVHAELSNDTEFG